MKKKIKISGSIAVVAVIVLSSLVSCVNASNNERIPAGTYRIDLGWGREGTLNFSGSRVVTAGFISGVHTFFFENRELSYVIRGNIIVFYNEVQAKKFMFFLDSNSLILFPYTHQGTHAGAGFSADGTVFTRR